LSEVMQEHVNVLAAAEACSAATAARQATLVYQLQSALRPPTKRGRPPADAARPIAVPAPALLAADALNKCCCGVVFQTTQGLKRHHNGSGGKQPREPAHPCTAGCTFPSRARE
jgi:hypothetical protein